MPIEDDIVRLAQERSRAWAVGDSTLAIALGKKLDEAYEEKRRAAAVNLHGSTKQIMHRARVERELEKLIADI